MREHPERRRSERVRLAHEGTGRLRASVSVRILNLSENGLLLESVSPVRPGGVYELVADLPGLSFRGRVRVTRCRACVTVAAAGTEPAVVYSAGAELLDVSQGSDLLRGWLEGRLESTDDGPSPHPGAAPAPLP